MVTPSKKYPIMTAITIVIRTIRKCMEKLRDKFDKVIFCFEDSELHDKFRENLKMYFPRNKDEEKFYARYIPFIQETEYGDVILPERTIQVKENFDEKDTKYIEYKNEEKSKVQNMYYDDKDDIKNYKMYISFIIIV